MYSLSTMQIVIVININNNTNNNNKTWNAHVFTLLGVQGAVKTNNKQNKTNQRKKQTQQN